MKTAVPRASTAPPLVVAEHRLKLRDGGELFYRSWVPEGPVRRAVVLFHRGHEHSGRWDETVRHLGLAETAYFAWDQRGHGHSSGERGTAAGISTVIADADEWFQHLVSCHGVTADETVVVAHSLGAVIATAWVHDFAPRIRGLVLATPAWQVNLFVPLALPALRLKERLLGPGFVTSYVSASMLTHDREQARQYQDDPLIFRQIAINMLVDLHDTSQRLLADAGAITVPLLVLAAGSDWVVKRPAQERFVERVSSRWKRFEILPGFSHAIFHETNRDQVVERIGEFIESCLAHPVDYQSLRHADQAGYTHEEYERLRRPGGYHFLPVKWSMLGPGRISRGIALGWKHGFDSGLMLDYIYANRAQGLTPIGRLVDRIYLDAIGWRGIRIRRQMMGRLLQRTMRQVHQAGHPVRLLDLAAGPGRYVLETMRDCRDLEPSALLRDYRTENLDAARKLAAELQVERVTVELGDAFDRKSIADVTPPPTIAVVSGLYELFPDNDRVMESLRGLADAVPTGGYLIYTNQPWHPQVELIARTLRNREGQAWVMRRRTQAEMDELVRAAGFEKVAQEIDPWGIFSVSVARRT